mmetsp:Transcript_55994/g.120499  ORF Transcript_55994/g.120499 Transcript_55994/m.120499 type:complete len:222 (+) Transcript_55994:458-1123(+)
MGCSTTSLAPWPLQTNQVLSMLKATPHRQSVSIGREKVIVSEERSQTLTQPFSQDAAKCVESSAHANHLMADSDMRSDALRKSSCTTCRERPGELLPRPAARRFPEGENAKAWRALSKKMDPLYLHFSATGATSQTTALGVLLAAPPPPLGLRVQPVLPPVNSAPSGEKDNDCTSHSQESDTISSTLGKESSKMLPALVANARRWEGFVVLAIANTLPPAS